MQKEKGMFVERVLGHQVLLHPEHFGPGLVGQVRKQLRQEVEGLCHGKYGFIIRVVEVMDVGQGVVVDNRGLAGFDVKYRAIVFRPFKNEVMDTVVESVSKMGFFSRTGPLQIFVSNHLIPSEFSFDEHQGYVSEDQMQRITKDKIVRLRIVGIRMDVGEIFAIGTIREDYLGILE